MADYEFFQRTTYPIRIYFKDGNGATIPVPAKFTGATAAMGITADSNTHDIPLTVDMTHRADGFLLITLSDDTTAAMKAGTEYTGDCLLECDDGTTEPGGQWTMKAKRVRKR